MPTSRPPSARSRLSGAPWLFAALAFAAVIVVVARRGEIEDVSQLLRHARVSWLLTAFGLQSLTYVLAAEVWQLALHASGHQQPRRSLMVLALAMLFSNQAMPSVGLSGGLVVAEALVRRGVPKAVAMSALLLGLVTTYAAFLAALAFTLVWVHASRVLTGFVVGATIAFSLMAGGVLFGLYRFRRLPSSWQWRLARLPVVGAAMEALATGRIDVLHDGDLLFKATMLQLGGIALDSATLGVCLRSLGYTLTPGSVLGCYVVASTASRVAFAPLGIGTFEAASVTMLHFSGVALEPALAVALVFRGFTLWLPMVPGLWCARRVLRTPHRTVR